MTIFLKSQKLLKTAKNGKLMTDDKLEAIKINQKLVEHFDALVEFFSESWHSKRSKTAKKLSKIATNWLR